MKKLSLVFAFTLLLCSCKKIEVPTATLPNNTSEKLTVSSTSSQQPIKPAIPTLKQIEDKYNGMKPTEWGENITGVISRIKTRKKTLFLTFDACGSDDANGFGNGYDRNLIDYLTQEKIPATLFINHRWIKNNQSVFKELAKNPLFNIENHGEQHRPLSVTGRSVYEITGTKSPKEAYEEIEKNNIAIKKVTGKRPSFFRAGTAYYDDVAIKIATDLGMKIAGYNVLGDAGATLSAPQILQNCTDPLNGSILLFHMNRPASETYLGIKQLIPILKNQNYKFSVLEAE